MSHFIRLLGEKDKAGSLIAAIVSIRASAPADTVFELDVNSLRAVPGAPFAYWVSGEIRELFARFPKIENDDGRKAVSTNPLNADFRFVRLWFEVGGGRGTFWRPWAKGGSFSRFYYDIDAVIWWDDDKRTYFGFVGTENRPLERPASVQHFSRPGLTWPRRRDGLSVRVLPEGSVFADKGPAVLVRDDDFDELLAVGALMNTNTFGYLIAVQLARTELAQSYEVGIIQQTPVPDLTPDQEARLASLARRAWSIKRGLDTVTETSHAFTLPALLAVPGHAGGAVMAALDGREAGEAFAPGLDLAGRAVAWNAHLARGAAALALLQAEIDDLAFALYGIGAEDRAAILAFDARRPQAGAAAPDQDAGDDADDED
ncbi:MAG: hypothetical protein HQL41_11815, partial [Alphaproteobacteria bacterium]|nr:hypothetical protein [Alphaproteobacteria bacterium]